jgi:hypothetical protein
MTCALSDFHIGEKTEHHIGDSIVWTAPARTKGMDIPGSVYWINGAFQGFTGDEEAALEHARKRIAPELFLQVGRKRYQVQSLEQASEFYCAARDRSGAGASRFPSAKIVTENGTEVASVSYNGRVWPAGDWKPGDTPIYDNRN